MENCSAIGLRATAVEHHPRTLKSRDDLHNDSRVAS